MNSIVSQVNCLIPKSRNMVGWGGRDLGGRKGEDTLSNSTVCKIFMNKIYSHKS